MKVLLVDDYGSTRRVTRKLLELNGITDIDEASDGASALQKLRESKYELVISDYEMKSMSGLELLKVVRADEKLKTIPFILTPAESTPEKLIEAKQAGVSNYIVKPFNAATLKQKIQSVMGEF